MYAVACDRKSGIVHGIFKSSPSLLCSRRICMPHQMSDLAMSHPDQIGSDHISAAVIITDHRIKISKPDSSVQKDHRNIPVKQNIRQCLSTPYIDEEKAGILFFYRHTDIPFLLFHGVISKSDQHTYPVFSTLRFDNRQELHIIITVEFSDNYHNNRIIRSPITARFRF